MTLSPPSSDPARLRAAETLWSPANLPDPYPEAWAWRGYNEQLPVACLLQSRGYRIRFASRYLVTRHPALLAAGVVGRLPLPAGALESSLWLEKLA